MNRNQFIALAVVLFAAAAGLVGCDGSRVPSIISINVLPSTMVAPGGKLTFSASISNSANPLAVSYSAQKGTIDSKGNYTAVDKNGANLAVGTDVVTVRANDGSAPANSVTVQIVSSIKIDQGPQSVSVGRRTLQFTAKIDGVAADNAKIDWSSSDSGISASTGLYTSPASSLTDGTVVTIVAKIKGTNIQDMTTVTIRSANLPITVQ